MLKRIVLLALVLSASSLYAQEPRQTIAATRRVAVPSVARDQARPENATKAARCGNNAQLPNNCAWFCRYGVPVLDANGNQRVVCAKQQNYSPPEAPCNRYYGCTNTGSGSSCAYTGVWESSCSFTAGGTGCSSGCAN